ncbi:D-amino-acid transaminase [Lentilitoribacter sp. EG35]|uniref:D-amino-acid transaminase n=1 Tax=Lentilitoribacter sp. EG35 TaxID=3234192 RepID=UPI003460E171
MRTIFVNGKFVDESDAVISVFDRGFLFADAVYEGIAVLGRKLVDFNGHIDRLKRSCGELDIPYQADGDEIQEVLKTLIERNNLDEGFIYFQVSRGAAERDFVYDNSAMTPSVVSFTQAKSIIDNPVAKKGISIATVEDLRWGRCDIKTVQLLHSSLSKMEAQKRGADDAWLVKDGVVLEGTSNNAYIVTNENTIVTRPLSRAILPGITRAAILQYAEETGIKVEAREFTVEEAKAANEAFITSATTFLFPVVEIDGQQIGDGKPGEISKRIRELYIQESLKRAI